MSRNPIQTDLNLVIIHEDSGSLVQSLESEATDRDSWSGYRILFCGQCD